MIVCLCKAVSDRAIRTARDAGASTLEAVRVATGAGSGCGCCHGVVERILAEPCRAVPCAGCPARAVSSGAVPARVAAAGLAEP